MPTNLNSFLSNPLVMSLFFWWGPALIILFGLYLLSMKFVPYLIRIATGRIDDNTKAILGLQQAMLARSEKDAIEHREILILIKTILAQTPANRTDEMTRALCELQHTLSARIEKEDSEHREMLVMVQSIAGKQ